MDGLGVIDTRFREALRRLAEGGRLVFFPDETDPELEIAALAEKFAGDKAVFFERVKGYSIPIVANILTSPANTMCVFRQDACGMRALMQRAVTHPIPPKRIDRGVCQEHVVTNRIDLGRMLPALRYAPKDCGRFITAGVVIARDPETRIPNASFHRLQLIRPDHTGIRLDKGRHLTAIVDKARIAAKTLPVAVCIGPDLSLLYAAASSVPFEVDELSIASGLKGEPLETVACKTVDIDVPSECEIVLEGHIDPRQEVHEGPFGEFVGMYSDAGPMPIVKISAVTSRKRPIYHIGYSETGSGLRKYIFENLVLRRIKDVVPQVLDVDATAGGLTLFHLVVSLQKQRPEDDALPRRVINAALAAHRHIDLVVVVDEDIDIHVWNEVEYALAIRFNAADDLHLYPGGITHEYVRAAKDGARTKIGIDATVPFEARERFRRVEYMPLDLDSYRYELKKSMDPYLC